MSKNLSNKPVVVGLLQALGVFLYTGLIAILIKTIDRLNFEESIFNIVFALSLLVFSAAVTGSMVFGYPAFLSINKNTKKALEVLGYTLMFLLILLLVVFTLIAFWQINFTL